MTFELRENMTSGEFEDEILNRFWPKLGESIEKREAGKGLSMIQDYAAIGAFLTDKARVLASLASLEAEIRSYVARQILPNMPSIQRFADFKNTRQPFKSRKILNTLLLDHEIRAGFNNPNNSLGQVTLHSQAKTGAGTVAAGFTMAPAGRQPNTTQLPAGKAPTVIGSLDPMDFNNILLRHGYQFKDVGATAAHGEYSHRLQWYAICHPANHTLALVNSPLELMKMTGIISVSKAPQDTVDRVEAGRHLYLWEALFDCNKTKAGAAAQQTIAFSPKTYNTPEVMNDELKKVAADIDYVDGDPTNLYCLRVLLNMRFRKRAAEEARQQDFTMSPTDKMFKAGDARQKLLVARHAQNQTRGPGDVPGGLIWYLTN